MLKAVCEIHLNVRCVWLKPGTNVLLTLTIPLENDFRTREVFLVKHNPFDLVKHNHPLGL